MHQCTDRLGSEKENTNCILKIINRKLSNKQCKHGRCTLVYVDFDHSFELWLLQKDTQNRLMQKAKQTGGFSFGGK